MAQAQQQNFQQKDNYNDPTVGSTAGTDLEVPADAVSNPPVDAEGNPPVDVSSTGYVPGESGVEFPDGTQPQENGEATTETGEAGGEIPPEEGALNPDEQADPEENPEDADGASVAGTGLTPPTDQPPAEDGAAVEIPEVTPEAKEGTETRRNSKKSQNYSTKHYSGRSGSRRRRKSGSGDYSSKSYYNSSQSTPTKPSAYPYPYGQQQQQPYQSPCQIGVIPMRSAAFQAPRIPLPKLCKNLLPCGADEGQEDEDGVAFQFKPQTHCRTEVTFTIEPKPQPPWLTMLNCGFKPMVNCSAPPCYLSPSGNPGMDYMGGTQTVVNRTFGTQVQYTGMANFPTLQQIQNSFPGGRIIDASRKDKKEKSVSSSGSSSESSSEESSTSESESEEEYHHYQHGHPYQHGSHQTHHHHPHQAPVHHQQHHPQHPHHHVQQHQHHQTAQAHQHQKQAAHAHAPIRRSTQRKSRLPSASVSSEDSRLPKKSTFTARRTLRASNAHDHHHKHRHSRHSHHHHASESSNSGQPAQSDLSRSSDWHM